jgi:tetratricopeptide (TPR) repeat protein
VGWVSEIKNTVSLPPFLLGAICFAKYDESANSGAAGTARRASANHVLAVFWFLVAMLAKTSMVMFPVVLLIHAWWRRGRIGVRDLAASAPFFLVSLILGLVTIHFQHGRAIGSETMPVADLFSLTGFLSRLAVAGMAIFFYFWKSIWPFHLLPIYPRWEVDPPQPWQLLPWPIIGFAVWWLWRRRGTAEAPTWERHTLMALGFFVLMLLPILGFITISYMRITWVADHFLYLPMIGPIALVSACAASWFATLQPRLRLPAVAAAVTAVAFLAGSSFRYAHVFAGEDPLWTYTLAFNPDAWQAHNRLGARKFARGDVPGGLSHFENSTRLRPDLGETHNNLGTALMATGRVEEGLEQFRIAAELETQIPQMQINLVNALVSVDRLEEAENAMRLLTERFPTLAQGWNFLGVVQMKRGNNTAAVESLRRAQALRSDSLDLKKNLHAALRAEADRLALEKSFAKSEIIYRELLKSAPDDVQLINNHGVTLFELGRREESVQAFRRALAINPDSLEAKHSLAIAVGAPVPPPQELQVPLPATLAPPAGLR